MKASVIKKFGKIGQFKLSEWCNEDGTSVSVTVRLDTKRGVAFQVDDRNKRYRSANAKTAGKYGRWKKLS